jgi:hypothetical protein
MFQSPITPADDREAARRAGAALAHQITPKTNAVDFERMLRGACARFQDASTSAYMARKGL